MEKNAWKKYDATQLEQLESLANQYKQFLNAGKQSGNVPAKQFVRQKKQVMLIYKILLQGKNQCNQKYMLCPWTKQ